MWLESQKSRTDFLRKFASVAVFLLSGAKNGNKIGKTSGFVQSGAKANLHPLLEQISLESDQEGSALIVGNSPRVFDVNVTNTSNGGNNSCTGGTESQITIDPLGISFRNSFLLLVND